MRIFLIGIMVLFVLSVQIDRINAFYITKAGVRISTEDYEELTRLGFQDYEIQLLPESTVREYIGMSNEYRTVFYDINYIHEKTMISNGVETIVVDELTKDEYDMSLDAREDQVSLFTLNPIATSFSTFDTIKSDTYKTMILSGSYSESSNLYFVKLSVKWDRLPLNRLHDVIAITHLDTVTLNMITSGDYQFPQYAARMLYSQNRFDSRTGGLSSVDISKTVNLNYQMCSTSCFRQSLNGILSVQNLPNDSIRNYYNSVDGYYVYGYVVKTVLHSLEGYFVPRTSNTNPEPFHGGFKHMTSDQFYTFGNLTVSYAPPYISYTPNFGLLAPSYDIELETQINVYK
jgi:hypothetical protein